MLRALPERALLDKRAAEVSAAQHGAAEAERAHDHANVESRLTARVDLAEGDGARCHT